MGDSSDSGKPKHTVEKSIDRMVNRLRGETTATNRANDRVANISRHLAPAANDAMVMEPARPIRVRDQCQVCVCGGGPAGLSAALAAARAGADVILIERYGFFGGTITTAGMETLGWYRYEGTIEANGLGREMERRAEEMGGTTKFPYNDSECLDADKFKIVADKLVTENNIRPLLHSMVVSVLLDENKVINGVVVESKSGREAIKADVVIDCTGDADVAHLAGAPYESWGVKDRLGVTTVINMSGVDTKEFKDYVSKNERTYNDWADCEDEEWQVNTEDNDRYLPGDMGDLKSPLLSKELYKAKADGLIDNTFDGSWSSLTDAGEATNLNLCHMAGCDATDVGDLTKFEMKGRQLAEEAVVAMKHGVPGFQNAKLRNIGASLGIRDTRKIVGRYNLTGDDVCSELRHEESIGIFPEFVDGYNVLLLPSTGRYFTVPYGCLVPQEVDNLLVAGRCVAGDRISHAAMRNMMACTVTGQGAGAAAGVAIRNGTTTGKVDIKLIQEELTQQGVRLQ